MTTEPTKDTGSTFAESFTRRWVKEFAEQISLIPQEDGLHTLRWRYGRESEPFKIQGKTSREQLRDLGVHIERFLGART